jgi:4-amino-4-deoxy-L-arabinose transferase-like glycosyltransferase
MNTGIWKSLSRWERWFLLFLIVLSLGLRLGYLSEMSKTLFLTHLRLDEQFHDIWAKSIASGNFIGDRIFFRAPLYAYWLGLNFAVFGHSYIIPRIIQHILGTASVVLLYFLARRLFDKKVALLSSLLMATYSAIIYQEDKFLFESILLIQLLVFFTLLYSIKEQPTFNKWFGTGILWGLICITRPILLPYFIILCIIIFVWYRKLFPWKKTLLWVGGISIGITLIIIPITIRNYILSGDVVLIASQGGINFYLGNNFAADGFSATMPGAPGNRWEKRDIEDPVRQEIGHPPSYSEVDRFWYKQGVHFITSQPWDYIKLTFKKLYIFGNNIEIPNNNSFYLYEQFSGILTWLPTGFWLIGPLGILGMIIAWRNKQGRIIIIFTFSYVIIVILFFVCDRFRLPILPFLCMMSGVATMKFWEARKNPPHSDIAPRLL